LLDSEILAEVYLELTGGRQPDFALSAQANARSAQAQSEDGDWRPRPRANPLPGRLTDEDRAAHAAFVAELGDGAVWSRFD
jgi:DNA polymerase-3 subunit epsilon